MKKRIMKRLFTYYPWFTISIIVLLIGISIYNQFKVDTHENLEQIILPEDED